MRYLCICTTSISYSTISSSMVQGYLEIVLGVAPKAARGRSMKARPTQSRGGAKGQLPLAGSRDSVPCGAWGNAPTVPRAASILNALNKGAGSEASLPVTLRVRRRASKLLFPQDSVKNYSSTPPWHSYLKNKNGYCGGFRPHTVPVFLMQSRGDYSAAGTEKEICVAPVMASADSIVMGDVSTLRVAKEPS